MESNRVIRRKITLDTLIVEVSPICNFKCKYCFLGEIPESYFPSLLNFEALKSIFKQFTDPLSSRVQFKEEIFIDHIILTGGEPLLGCPSVVDANYRPTNYFKTLMFARFLSKSMAVNYISIFSNGSAKPECYKELSKIPRVDFWISDDDEHRRFLSQYIDKPIEEYYNELLETVSPKPILFFKQKSLIYSGFARRFFKDQKVPPESYPKIWNPEITISTSPEFILIDIKSNEQFLMLDALGRLVVCPDIDFKLRDKFTIAHALQQNDLYIIAKQASDQYSYFNGLVKSMIQTGA